MKIIHKNDNESSEEFEEYLEHHDVSKTFKDENERLRRVVNQDLASENSVYKKRTELLKKQLKNIKDALKDEERSVYFFGVGHHPNLITLDVAFNNRENYDATDDLPTPLTMWSVDKEKVDKFLED